MARNIDRTSVSLKGVRNGEATSVAIISPFGKKDRCGAET